LTQRTLSLKNKGLSNGGNQEEDAGHEGGEGQCHGPL